jgi:hypothetical protein
MNVEISDIVSDGSIRIYRQRTDTPFRPEDITVAETEFASLETIDNAYSSSAAKIRDMASMHRFAWNPEFGYITSNPEICGTGIEISAMFHLEGLHIIGDLPPVLNALTALRMRIVGREGEGMRDAAHLFRISNAHMLGIGEQDLVSRVSRIFCDLAKQESNARIRLVEENPRLFEDSILRSLAVLRSCRLISEWELLDIISPLRLAAEFGFLDRFTRDDALAITRARLEMPDTPVPGSFEEQCEKDRKDGELADKVNKRFKNVRLNARAKEYLSS